MTPDELARYRKAQKGRNIALGLVLLGLAVLFYAITFARFGAQ